MLHAATHDEGVQSLLEHQTCHSKASRMLHRRERVLDDKFDIEICPNLVEDDAQAVDFGVGEHDKLQPRGRLIVVELVFAGAVAEEGIVLAAELVRHVAEGEDQAEDELRVIFFREGFARGRGAVAIARDAGARLRAAALVARGDWARVPFAAVYALR